MENQKYLVVIDVLNRRYEMWERVAGNTYRLEVPGGWIVRYIECNTNYGNGASDIPCMIFVADASHRWLRKNKKEV